MSENETTAMSHGRFLELVLLYALNNLDTEDVADELGIELPVDDIGMPLSISGVTSMHEGGFLIAEHEHGVHMRLSDGSEFTSTFVAYRKPRAGWPT